MEGGYNCKLESTGHGKGGRLDAVEVCVDGAVLGTNKWVRT